MLLDNNLDQEWTYTYFETVFTQKNEVDAIKKIKPNLYTNKHLLDRYVESRKSALSLTTHYTPSRRIKHTFIDEKELKKEDSFMNVLISNRIKKAHQNALELRAIPKIYMTKIVDLCRQNNIDFTVVIEPMPKELNKIFKQSKFKYYLLDKNITVRNINDYYTFNNYFFKSDGIHVGKDVNRYYQNLLDKNILDIY